MLHPRLVINTQSVPLPPELLGTCSSLHPLFSKPSSAKALPVKSGIVSLWARLHFTAVHDWLSEAAGFGGQSGVGGWWCTPSFSPTDLLPVWVRAWKKTKMEAAWEGFEVGGRSWTATTRGATPALSSHFVKRRTALTPSSSILRSRFAGEKQYGGSWGGGWRMIAHAQSSCCFRLIGLSEHF